MSANRTQDRQRLQSAVWFTLRAVITLGLLGYVASRLDLTTLAQRLREARPGCLILAFSMLLAQVFVAASRWNFVNVRLLYRIGYPSCLRYTFEGLFFGQMLPSSVGGDVLRVWRARQRGMPLTAATTGVFLNRLSALIAVLFAVLVGMPLLFKKVEIPGFAEAVGVLLGSTFLGLVSLGALDRIALLPRHWRVTTLLHRLAAASRTLFITP